jgi:uncharacterized membrane protein YqhA
VGWIYILIRTYPFWAIPLGVALLTAAIKTRKGSAKKKMMYIFISISLLMSSGFFLYHKGHMTAVPFFHQLIHGQR